MKDKNLRKQKISLRSTSPFTEGSSGPFGEMTFANLLPYQYQEIIMVMVDSGELIIFLLKEYLLNYAEKVGAKLVQGTSNNDLVVAKMNSAYFKVGGYNRPSGYYLEGEDNRANDGGFEEHEQEHWAGDEDEN